MSNIMHLSLYNSLSRKKEAFQPLNKDLVTMYVCGPTVYDHPHIGNARSVITYDILYRILIKIYGREHVKYIRNITDIDDKIIDNAKKLGVNIADLTSKTTADFHYAINYLNCLNPSYEPKATEHIAEMILIIEKLISANYAYISDKHVYFDVSKAKDYTALSGRAIDQMLDGVRIENSILKKHQSDFVLWKPINPDEEPSENFDSPWGIGRPGWHIECSAMSYKYLGEDFDIHGGGVDLIFPHHTNEIAQSVSAFPGSNFAKYWVHNGFLTCNGEKMSKSLGNFITVKDLIDKKIEPDAARLFLLSTHYRKPLDYNDKAINDSAKMINYWYRAIEELEVNSKPQEIPDDFLAPLLDDMNLPLAIKIINDYAKAAFAAKDQDEKNNNSAKMLACAHFLGLMKKTYSEWFHHGIDDKLINDLIAKRAKAKLANNWAEADKIRQELLQKNIILEDKKDGATSWKVLEGD
jgi:cysteinyl-tRNA synthetase